MRLALAQINTTVGDLDGNRERILARLEEARGPGADIVLFPELAVTGYPPEDLLLRPSFVRPRSARSPRSRSEARGIAALVGVPHLDRDLYNACAVCAGGEVKAIYRKRFLPNYGVFDEHRYFAPGRDLLLLEHGDALIGPTVCEDVWQPGPPATDLALAGAQLLVNISASPFHVGKAAEREQMLADPGARQRLLRRVRQRRRRPGRARLRRAFGRARRRGRGARARAGVRGGAARGRHRAQASVGRRLRDVRRRSLENEREVVPEVPVVHIGAPRAAGEPVAAADRSDLDDLEQMRLALELGLRDYVEKNGFHDVVVSVSGGIDSALDAAIAREALGPDRVHCVSMPSRFSSEETRRDARAARRDPRHRLPRAPDRADRRELPRDARAASSRAASRTRPRRTSRRGPAACC